MADKEDRGDSVTDEQAEEAKKLEEAKAAEEEAAKKPEEEAAKKPEEEESEEEEVAPGVPNFRFRAVTAQKKKLEQENAALAAQVAELEKAGTAPKAEPKKEEARDFDAELDAADAALLEAMEAGDNKAIVAANKSIRAIESARTTALVAEARNEGVSAQETVAQRAFDETLEIIENEFPALVNVEGNEAFDKDKHELVQRLLTAFEGQGMPSDTALIDAVAIVFPDNEVAPTGKDRGIKDKISAASRTPADINAGGQNSDKAGLTKNIDVTKLSDADFKALPVEERKKMRGDML